LFVCSSTTTPNASDTVLIPMIEKETGWKCGPDFGFCYNPEFIALGNVVNGLLDPDMVLIGESHAEYGEALEAAYKKYNRNQPQIARMSIISAELTKISLNSYITMKISFTNQLRLIAEQFPKADIHGMLDALGSDTRIGKKYLRAGQSWRPVLPALTTACWPMPRGKLGSAPLAEATDRVKRLRKECCSNRSRSWSRNRKQSWCSDSHSPTLHHRGIRRPLPRAELETTGLQGAGP
jgi:UDPglucose 6-dehydrogenase